MNVILQGIKNSPPTFQRIINKLLENLQWKCALSYTDDIIVYWKSFSEYLHRLEQMRVYTNENSISRPHN